MATIAWAGRLAMLGASNAEIANIQAGYDASPPAARRSLNTIVDEIDNLALSAMLAAWRASGGPFGAGFQPPDITPGIGTSVSIVWAGRLAAAGASALEVEAIQCAYDSALPGVQAALDQVVAGIANTDLAAMLAAWRSSGGPFGAGYPGGGLPFGTLVGVAGTDGSAGGPGGTPFFPGVTTVGNSTATLQRVTIAAPASGADWSYVVPASTWVRLLTGVATLTTSATVANRVTGLRIVDPSAVQCAEFESTQAIVASQVQKVTYGIAAFCRTDGTVNDGIRPVMIGQVYSTILGPGYTLAGVTPNLQSGGQWSAVELLLQQWTAAPTFDALGPAIT